MIAKLFALVALATITVVSGDVEQFVDRVLASPQIVTPIRLQNFGYASQRIFNGALHIESPQLLIAADKAQRVSISFNGGKHVAKIALTDVEFSALTKGRVTFESGELEQQAELDLSGKFSATVDVWFKKDLVSTVRVIKIAFSDMVLKAQNNLYTLGETKVLVDAIRDHYSAAIKDVAFPAHFKAAFENGLNEFPELLE